jgi:DNA helicase-2/ATP-dependent DNA helicase PcrA
LIALNRKFEKLFGSGGDEAREPTEGLAAQSDFGDSKILPLLASDDNYDNYDVDDVADLDQAAEGEDGIDVVDAILENDISEKLSDEEMDLEEESGCMTDAVHHLMEHLKYRQEIERLYTDADEAVMRIGSLEAVLNAVAQYEQDATEPNLGDFLASVTLSGREYGSSKDKNAGMNAVSLMTYHSAKGLEFPIVYMVGMEEGVLPHRRSITEEGDSVDEERRLCYVGVTRAQDELALTLPLSRFKWGKPRPTYPSRFLYELTDQADNPNRAKAIKAAADEARKASRTAR